MIHLAFGAFSCIILFPLSSDDFIPELHSQLVSVSRSAVSISARLDSAVLCKDGQIRAEEEVLLSVLYQSVEYI